MEKVLSYHDVELRFGKKTVLEKLDLDVEAGAVTVMLGTNGVGKSTLLRLALGVLKPQRGTVRVFGRDPVRAARTLRQNIGYVPDVPDVWGWMTVREFYRFLAPQYRDWCAARAKRLAERLELPLETRFRALSRGQGMKAMLVAALAHDPDLLLLDEPFGGLDPLAREELLAGVLSELRTGEHTILLTTHELELAARCADRVAIVHEGRIELAGSLDDLLGPEAHRVPEELHNLLASV